MKKFLSLFFAVLLLAFCGCSQDSADSEKERTDYIINENEEITIGVIAPLSSENASIGNDVLSGVEFANNMASSVNIDKRYNIKLSVYDCQENLEETAEKLISDKVAAVICYGADYEKTNIIIDSFESSATSLLFIDSCSDKISDNSTSLTLSAPATYKASVLASYISNEGFKDGAIIFEANDYNEDFAESFASLLKDTYGVSTEVVEYSEGTDIGSVAENKEFAFVAGNNDFSSRITKALKETVSDLPVFLTEMYRSFDFADTLYDDTYFLSKFEFDENNHYVTDFMNVYSNVTNVSKSEISAAVAYGYDAYMIIYGALGSLNPNSTVNPLDSVKNSSDIENKTIEITASQVYDAVTKGGKVYGGPIDTITFETDGTMKPSYIFIDGVNSGTPYMVNKFVY